MDNYKDFSEDERIFYLREAGFDSREKELFRLRVYEEKTLADTVAVAHKQIEEKRYDEEILTLGIEKERIRHYGFAFEGKKVLIG